MRPARPTPRRRARTGAAAAGIALLAGSLAACGADSEDTASAGPDGSTSAVGNNLVTAMKPLDAYPVPTEKLDNVDSVAGKTIFYVPITKQAPQFTTTEKAVAAAAETVGLRLQVCDGKGTPTDIGGCISQATDAKAAAIIADAIPYALAANGLDAAQKAGIPVVISNQVPDPSHPASKTLTWVQVPGSEQQIRLFDWIASDSKGKANILVNQSSDGLSPASYVADGKAALTKSCPDCKLTINKVTSSNFALIPSSTSAVLLKDPTISYADAQFEQYLQPTQGGVQQASRTDIKVVTGSASLGGMKALKSGSLAAVTAQAAAFQGWVNTDAALRLILGKPVPEYNIPTRLFTKDNIGDIKLTEEAELSGEWFGPATFTDDFKKLWGVA
ncbi:substrate-binding domain-containing protein [Streptomyces phaeochromogenes]|uniref:Substrate-binding domain-containing protein n=1 Tax=Streptomyces phaeochromogenes TaxID=1923 RepID=A0ABZ1H7N6_STRPH|nr:substrate-binding domain-containing protein [Streptomyces phaeochromogenes]MCX5599849.1 substrate-binding domain-containing protein [Streptomyces phaeochromogenes]WRZ27599.1 substrate-binding domain-containing protein [Streptomyces phaeochromogenes]WSD13163.1 substrate-binding domain-containing protein [Streptomyces phaeochromogenes]WSJ10041.1 substrate-binding domain-containing protein [Streptomyces phaeochromogenes]